MMRQINALSLVPVKDISVPKNGWVATVRKALGMSGAELGRRVGLKRGRISQVEKSESQGSITIRSMEKMAEGLGCRFVYAIVPEDGDIESVIRDQAHKKARQTVERAATHMALEQQSIGREKNLEEIEMLADDLVRTQPPGFWE